MLYVKNYTINQTTLPLDMEQYIPETDVAFAVNAFVEIKDKSGFVRDFKNYECENCRDCPVRSQCTKAKSERNRQILVNNTLCYFKAECKKKLLEEKTGSIYWKRKIDVEPVFGHLKAHLAFQRFHLRGKQGAKIDIGLALMALNLRKLGKYMERKRRKEEKTSPILKLTIKIGLVFFWRKDYCPILFPRFFIKQQEGTYPIVVSAKRPYMLRPLL